MVWFRYFDHFRNGDWMRLWYFHVNRYWVRLWNVNGLVDRHWLVFDHTVREIVELVYLQSEYLENW